MMDSKIEAALNAQINLELSSGYAYLGMAAYFETLAFNGFSKWMQLQRNEELGHAQRLWTYLLDRGGKLILEQIDKPQVEFASVQEVFEVSLKQEQNNTASINKLYALASEKDDYATQSALQWFVDEQVEEEKTVEDILQLVKTAGDDRGAIFILDQRMSERQSSEIADTGA